MLYQALYRKYRPKTFDDVSGQEVIVKTLKNIVANNKLTHAYLFIGPRGTGKTSIAKIFAKTINCENSIAGVSCEKCHVCLNNNSNENADIIEMDAASNNGVDEIREIKNHVTLMPSISKYKVYIIDEVHMLTTGAFNALLKTLEEPPKHVIFILATTEPHKIPLTIISRCQSFEFKPIPKLTMINRLKYICDEEKIKIEESALDMIADNSNGGMRDAISLLDQLNAYSNGDIKISDVEAVNGRIGENDIYELFKNISENRIKECFDFIEELDKDGKDFYYICDDIIKSLRNHYIKYQIGEHDDLINMLKNNDIVEIIMLFNNAMNDMKNTKDKKIFFELTIIKIINNNNIKQTNVRDTKNKENSKIEIKNNENINNEIKNDFQVKEKEDRSDYINLMNIRLNNILAKADKNSLNNYINAFNKIASDVTDLDKLKIINLMSDCNIKAGSLDGVIITTESDNILEELYQNLFVIEEILSNCINKKTKICFLLDEIWLPKREEYIDKIKNKINIEIIDEESILKNISSKVKNGGDVFDDLLEIGE